MQIAFISGPYRSDTLHGIHRNVDAAAEVALKYWKLGYAVICPHKNTAFFDGECPDHVWLDGYMAMMHLCDVVVMRQGWEKSQGSRDEHLMAKETGIRIIYDSGEL
jgi:hypothetical protein